MSSRNLTIKRLEAIADALAQLDAKNRRFSEPHYYAAEAWALQELKRRRSRKRQPEML